MSDWTSYTPQTKRQLSNRVQIALDELVEGGYALVEVRKPPIAGSCYVVAIRKSEDDGVASHSGNTIIEAAAKFEKTHGVVKPALPDE